MVLRRAAASGSDRGRGRSRSKSRGVSSTLDTVLFVLLIGVAVAVLAGVETAERTHADRTATETADVLATSTTTVEYERTAEVQHGLLSMREERTVRADRTAHGTYAELLAAGVVADARYEGRSLTGSNGALASAVETELEGVLPHGGRRTHVRATWQPYPGAPVGSEVTAGTEPPNATDVSATTVAVPSGLPVDEDAIRQAGRTGFRDLASVVADGVIRGLFPPEETRTAIRSDGVDRPLVVARFDSASSALNIETRPAIEDRDVETASDLLRAELADRLRLDLRRRYDSPRAAAEAVRTGRVRITVRTWSP